MKVDIKGEKMIITGRYGEYEIKESNKGKFLVSILFHAFVNEVDETGDIYLLEKGEKWKIQANSLNEINTFILACEEAKLWNVLKGIIYRIKIDETKGLLYIRGASRNYIIGEETNRLFMDETVAQKTHHYINDLHEAITEIIQQDKWWHRKPDEIIETLENHGNIMEITDGGNLRFILRNNTVVIGQKEDETFWIATEDNVERHVYYRDTLKEIFTIINSGGKIS